MEENSKKSLGKRLLSFVLMLAMAVTLMPMMSLLPGIGVEVVAADSHDHSHDGWIEVDSFDKLPVFDSAHSENYGKTFNLILTDDIEIETPTQSPYYRWGIIGDSSTSTVVNLCLNGHVISSKNNSTEYPLIKLENNGELNIFDCNPTKEHDYYEEYWGEDGPAVWRYAQPTHPDVTYAKKTMTGGMLIGGSTVVSMDNSGKNKFTLYGGTIAGGEYNTGGGVQIRGENNTFIMEGGCISGNRARDTGGGVYIVNGKFEMHGGKITGNAAMGMANRSGNGGGVCTDSDFTFTGGTISNNTSMRYGGGVYIEGSSFTMSKGCSITGNSAVSGGGVYIDGNNSTFTMESGVISGNNSEESGGGIFGYDSTITINEGEISENEALFGGGIAVDGNTDFTFKDGSIKNNKAQTGGGVYVYGGDFSSANFEISDSSIINNSAEVAGGGVYISREGIFTAYNSSITGNSAGEVGGGVYVPYVAEMEMGQSVTMADTRGNDTYYSCLAAGTLITLADGSRTAIENLKEGDEVRVFDHETGTLSTSKIFRNFKFPEKRGDVFTLHFTSDIDVTVVSAHCFYEKDENKYVDITSDNAKSFIGHKFYNADNARWETLESVDFSSEKVDTYYAVSERALNTIANGMLSNVDGFYTALCNIFDYDEKLTIDPLKKAEDIEKYGLCEYNRADLGELFDIFTKESYEAHNLKYIRIAFAKGVMTKADVDKAVEFAKKYLSNKEDKNPKILYSKVYGSSIPGISDPGIYLGGSVKITGNYNGNNSDNLFMWDDFEDEPTEGLEIYAGSKKLSILSGDYSPNNMKVGITIKKLQFDMDDGDIIDNGYSEGVFTTSATADDINYFIPDNENYFVEHNNGVLKLTEKTDPSEDYDVWVGEKQVNNFNKDDILRDGGSVKYSPDSKTLTLENTKIAGTALDRELDGIRSKGGLNIVLKGNNIIGRAGDLKKENPNQFDFAVYRGIFDETSNSSLNFSGDGTLTIYDYKEGIAAGNVYFGKDKTFSGTVNVYDYGGQDASCAIYTQKDVELLGGNFNLNSVNSNGIQSDGNGGGVIIKNATVDINAGWAGILSHGPISIFGANSDVTVSGNIYGIKGDASVVSITDGTIKAKGENAAIYAEVSEGNPLIIGSSDKALFIKNAKKKVSITDSEGVAITEGKGENISYVESGYCSAIFVADKAIEDGFVVIGAKTTPTPAPIPRPQNSTTNNNPTGGTIAGGTGTGGSSTVSVNVTGGSVVVDNIAPTVIESAAKAQPNSKEIVIDVSNFGNDTTNVTITKTTAENIAKTLKSDANNKESLTIITKAATVSIDAVALSSIANQAQSSTIQLVVENINTANLNTEQKAEVESIDKSAAKEVIQSFDAYFISGGKRISSFNNGTVTVGKIDYKIPAGKNARYYHVYYIPESGKAKRHLTWVRNNIIYFETSHFSNYVIVYDEKEANDTYTPAYRLYDANRGEHVYTFSVGERNRLVNVGWTDETEKDGSNSFFGSSIKTEICNKPVYRVYNPNGGGNHHYTLSKGEMNNLVNQGWIADFNGKPAFYVSTDKTMGVIFYRSYNVNSPSGEHHISRKGEHDFLVKSGWQDEGFCFVSVER